MQKKRGGGRELAVKGTSFLPRRKPQIQTSGR